MKRTCPAPHINASGRLTDFYKDLISLALHLPPGAPLAVARLLPWLRGSVAEVSVSLA